MHKSRIEDKFITAMRPELKKELGLSNIMEVPKIEKIVINVGIKEAVSSKFLKTAMNVLAKITGQLPIKTVAKKSIAGFKIREGMTVGAMITLRGNNMYHFLDKLISVALPKVRDFQGVTSKFDGRGNYNLGIKDWNIFPEAEKASNDMPHGMNITIHTSAKTDENARALLDKFGMPFKKK